MPKKRANPRPSLQMEQQEVNQLANQARAQIARPAPNRGVRKTKRSPTRR